MDIGNKIRQLRTQKGLTLEELASRSELTKGFLSQLERNLTSPSIDSLDDILEALGTNLAEFFQEDKVEQYVFRDADFFIDEREDCTVHWIVPNTQKNRMEPILLTLPENGRSFEVAPHSGEEFGFVVDGTVTLTCDGKRSTLRKGETFYLHGHTFHSLSNEHKAAARVLWVSTPPLF
ncbi:MAG: cupin domain-containing protein [Ruminococcaceae bacterium]|nr:cupin domain-containing protein [Oscillospiraceae bacterium]